MNKYKIESGDYTVNIKYPLKPEQNEIIDYVFSYFNVGIGAQTGFGKTYISLSVAERVLSLNPDTVCFIICPVTANSAFTHELKDKIKKTYSIFSTEKVSNVPSARYFIFNYSRLEYLDTYLKEMRDNGKMILAILDEIHVLASPTSQQSIALKDVRNQFSMVVGLTATPLTQNLLGTYYIADYIRPNCLGSEWEFKANYCIYKQKIIRLKGGRIRKVMELVGYKNLESLNKILETIFIIRRNKYNLDFNYHTVKLTDEETRMYLKASDGILEKTTEDMPEKDFSARIHDLQRVADGSHEVISHNSVYSKVKELLRTVKICIDRNEGCIVYTDYESTYTLLYDMIVKYKSAINYNNIFFITGKTPQKDRHTCEKTHGRKDIIIVTKAGCQSINLQKVNNVIFYNTPFRVLQMIQCVGRVARMDTEYDVQHIYVIEADNTIDTYKRLLVQDNATLIKQVFGTETNLPDIESIDKTNINKYRSYFKNKFLWKRDVPR